MRPRAFEFHSQSRPDGPTHLTTIDENDLIYCTCRGYMTKNRCWHYHAVIAATIIPLNEFDQMYLAEMLDEDCELLALQFIKNHFPSISRVDAYDLLGRIHDAYTI